MGIQSTRTISRDHAIERIEAVLRMCREGDYRALQMDSDECGDEVACIIRFVVEHRDCNPMLDKWTNRMLGDRMSLPFFRHSIFDNYLVEDEVDDA